KIIQLGQVVADLVTTGTASLDLQHDKEIRLLKDSALSAEEFAQAKTNSDLNWLTKRTANLEATIQREAALYGEDVTNFNSAENRKLRQQAANINAEIQDRQKLIDAQVTVNVERLSGIDKAASNELEIAAKTVDGVIAVRQKEIDQLNSLNTASE